MTTTNPQRPSHLVDEAGRIIATASYADCSNASYWLALGRVRTFVIPAWWL